MRKWLPLTTVSIGTFMLLVDVTIVNVALPRMSTDLHSSFSSLQWTIDIYALALAALMLGIGSVADLIGRKPVYIGGLILFALSSLGAGLATDPVMLIVFRGVEGIGGAAMFATTTALLNEAYQGPERGTAYGIWGAIAAAAVTYALTRASENGWTSPETLGCFALGALATAAFLLSEHRRRQPMIELSLLARPRFSGILLASMLLSISAFGALTYLSLWMQSVQDMSPIATGLALIPLSLLSLIVSASVGRRLHDRSPALPIAGGLGLIGIGALLQAHLGAGSGWTAVLPGLIVAGVGSGLAAPTLSSAALSAVPLKRGGMASGALNTARQFGYAIGIAGLGVICQTRIAARLTATTGLSDADAAAHALIGGQRAAVLRQVPAAHRATVDHAVHAAFASGLNLTLLVAAGCGIVGAAVVLLMLGRRGEGQAAESVATPA